MHQRTILRRIFDRISGAEARTLNSARAAAVAEFVTADSDRRILTERVCELMAQIRTLARAAEFEGAVPLPVTAGGFPANSRRRAKFTVFSNPRSGSTWLETMLGLLPDVHVDYELKWGVTYTASGIGVVLDESSRTISQVLEEMETDAPVTGSKFVFDAHGLTPLDFQMLRGKIGPDVRVIHLTRCYRDVFLSMQRGFYHAPARVENLSDRLRNALASADISRAETGAPQSVPSSACFRQVGVLLDNDLYIKSLHAAGVPYLQISYDEVAKRFADVAGFGGSAAPPAVIAGVLARPAVAKLPNFTGESVVANLAELEPLFEAFEILRQALVVQANPPTGG